jgi:tetratricopeptide (TPR) repeat protein
LIEIALLRRIYQAPELFQLLATFALVLIINDLVQFIWGPEDLLGPRAPGLRGSIPITAYIFAGVFLLRLVVLVRLTASPFLLPGQGDMHFYNDWAQRILHGQLTDYRAFYGLPLYPYFLAALYKLFGYSPFIPGCLQVAADSGTAVLLYKMARRVFDRSLGNMPENAGHYIGLTAAAVWAFYLPEQAYSVILMPTALAVFVFWFVVWQVIKRETSPSALTIFLLGLLVGFSATGVATVLFLIPMLLAALFLKWENPFRNGRRFLLASLLMAGVVLGVAPCAAHNYLVAHDRVFLSAHSGVNFWIGNNPNANGYPRMPPGLHAGQEAMLQDSMTVAQRNSERELKRSEISNYWANKARAYIRENPGAWLRLVGLKIANFWNAFQYDDLSIITNLRLQGVLLPGVKFGLIAVLALPGIVFALRSTPLSRWLFAAVLLHMASLLTVFVTERYRLAAVPGLILFAVFGAFLLWHYLATAQYSQAALYFAALILSGLFISIPKKDPSLWALDPYNSGWQALDSKNYALAREKLQLAYAYVPENAEINFALGNLQLEQADKAGAKAWYARTLKIDGDHEGSWNNLGVLALEEERWELAAKFFRNALHASPNDAKTHYLLARAYRGDGNLPEARREIEQALRLRPNQAEFTELQKTLEAE